MYYIFIIVEYYNKNTRSIAIKHFRQDVFNRIDCITKFCSPKNVNYELDKLKITDNYTIIEVFRREGGVNSSIGFLFSSDFNKNFKYIDFKEIYKDAECIEKVQFNSKDNSITVSLISLYPSEKFISYDFGHSWKLITN